ncbi:hypothetical protein NEDG_01487 [Nematocida displodere]|uniref:Uncharacterized protein n=1 Tax=Nematocida displodere TaxID=1805483 RepID=A0A177EEV8_9MICR|nr:hypothetical protein NEDG_01487 [Nematocida displodere]
MKDNGEVGELSGSESDDRDNEEIYYEPYDENLVHWLSRALKTHEDLKKARNAVINRHFGELNISVKIKEQEKLLLINEYINKEFVYPHVFLGSSLGFNKNNWNRNIEKLLEPFDIKQKPVFGMKDSCFLFEKLKFLLLKLIERSRK